jgi:hypothetical protein
MKGLSGRIVHDKPFAVLGRNFVIAFDEFSFFFA